MYSFFRYNQYEMNGMMVIATILRSQLAAHKKVLSLMTDAYRYRHQDLVFLVGVPEHGQSTKKKL